MVSSNKVNENTLKGLKIVIENGIIHVVQGPMKLNREKIATKEKVKKWV